LKPENRYLLAEAISCSGGVGMSRLCMTFIVFGRMLLNLLHEVGAIEHISNDVLIRILPSTRTFYHATLVSNEIDMRMVSINLARSGFITLSSDVGHLAHNGLHVMAVLANFFDNKTLSPRFVVADSVRISGESGILNANLLMKIVREYQRRAREQIAEMIRNNVPLTENLSVPQLAGVHGDDASVISGTITGQAGMLRKLNVDENQQPLHTVSSSCSLHGGNSVYTRSCESAFGQGFDKEKKSLLALLKTWAWLQEDFGYDYIVFVLDEAVTNDKISTDLAARLKRIAAYICVTRWLTVAHGVILLLEVQDDETAEPFDQRELWYSLLCIARIIYDYHPRAQCTGRQVWRRFAFWLLDRKLHLDAYFLFGFFKTLYIDQMAYFQKADSLFPDSPGYRAHRMARVWACYLLQARHLFEDDGFLDHPQFRRYREARFMLQHSTNGVEKAQAETSLLQARRALETASKVVNSKARRWMSTNLFFALLDTTNFARYAATLIISAVVYGYLPRTIDFGDLEVFSYDGTKVKIATLHPFFLALEPDIVAAANDLPPELTEDDGKLLGIFHRLSIGVELTEAEESARAQFGRLRVFHHPSNNQSNENQVKRSKFITRHSSNMTDATMKARHMAQTNNAAMAKRVVMQSNEMKNRMLAANQYVTQGSATSRKRRVSESGNNEKPPVYSTRFQTTNSAALAYLRVVENRIQDMSQLFSQVKVSSTSYSESRNESKESRRADAVAAWAKMFSDRHGNTRKNRIPFSELELPTDTPVVAAQITNEYPIGRFNSKEKVESELLARGVHFDKNLLFKDKQILLRKFAFKNPNMNNNLYLKKMGAWGEDNDESDRSANWDRSKLSESEVQAIQQERLESLPHLAALLRDMEALPLPVAVAAAASPFELSSTQL